MYLRFLLLTCAVLWSAAVCGQKVLPAEYTFLDIATNDSVRLTDIPYKRTLMLVLYDPGCDHCWTQAAAIAQDLSKFKKTKMVWISINTPKAIAEFRDKYFKGKMSRNMVFLHDPKMAIFKKFDDFYETPNVLIYDQHQKLVVTLPKSTVDKIYPYIK